MATKRLLVTGTPVLQNMKSTINCFAVVVFFACSLFCFTCQDICLTRASHHTPPLFVCILVHMCVCVHIYQGAAKATYRGLVSWVIGYVYARIFMNVTYAGLITLCRACIVVTVGCWTIARRTLIS
jgi:hypothetical protein